MALPSDVVKDFEYLKEKSAKGQLQASNEIYKKLDQKALNLPELRRALQALRVNY